MADIVYVSITGLELRGFWHIPTFWRHAIASMAQAKAADGCISAEARTIKGVHHTRTVWKSRAHMHAYLNAGAHARAMKVFKRIATGKTFGYETDSVPDWNEVRRLWAEKGRLSPRYA